MDAVRTELITVLRAARELLARPNNDFAWSSWVNADSALKEMDQKITAVEAGCLPNRLDLTVLFAATGSIQEVSLSSGWSREFLVVAERFDAAMARVYFG